MQKDWYRIHKTWRTILLMPFSWLFCVISQIRKFILQKSAYKSKLPVIIVGNITVGGTGKTPVVEAVCQFLQIEGYHPALITRGYGVKIKNFPLIVNGKTSPEQCGDEPFMLNNLLQNIPVIVSPKRIESIKYIEQHLSEVDVIVSDDGLQHYAIRRDVEIVVVDGVRMFGNGLCMPAGPLRETTKRLETVDIIIINGKSFCECVKDRQYTMKLTPQNFINLKTEISYTIDDFFKKEGLSCFAIAGIGNPRRFFSTLISLGLNVVEYPFQDHHSYVTLIRYCRAIQNNNKTFIFIRFENALINRTISSKAFGFKSNLN